MIDVVEKIVQREKLLCGDGDVRIEPLAGGLVLEAYFGKGQVGEEHLAVLQDLKYVNVVREAAWAYFYSGLGIQFETHAFDYAGHAARTVEKLIAGENSLGV